MYPMINSHKIESFNFDYVDSYGIILFRGIYSYYTHL